MSIMLFSMLWACSGDKSEDSATPEDDTVVAEPAE